MPKFDIKKILQDKDISKNDTSDPFTKKLLAEVFTGIQGRYTRLKIIMCLSKGFLNDRERRTKLYKKRNQNLKEVNE